MLYFHHFQEIYVFSFSKYPLCHNIGTEWPWQSEREILHWWTQLRAESRISFPWKNSNWISHNSRWYLCFITLVTFIRAGELLCSGIGQQVVQGGHFSSPVPCGHHGERTGKRRRLTKGSGLLHSVRGFWPDSVGKKYPSPMPLSQEATRYLVIW